MTIKSYVDAVEALNCEGTDLVSVIARARAKIEGAKMGETFEQETSAILGPAERELKAALDELDASLSALHNALDRKTRNSTS